MFSKMRELPGGNRLPAKTDSRQDSQETKSKGNESNPRLSDEEKRSSGFEGREDDLLVVADHFQKGYHSDKIIRSTRDKTYLELEGQKEQLICKVLWDIESANDWTHTVPYKGGHENLDIEHYVMFALNDTVKWLDLVHIFPKNVIEQNIVGFILVNYQESLHVPDDFFGDQKLHDMFVCVIRHGDQHRMMSYIEEKSSAARVRIVRSTCVDLPEENSYCQGNHRSAASMLSEYFSVADANGLDLGLYCHIFSFLDNMSEFDKPKDGIEVVKNRLAKEKFQLAHFLLYCAMLYKMTKKGHYLEKKQPSKVKSCVKSFFNVLIEELNISISEISQIVNDHLLFDNVHVRDGSSDKQFFDFLGDACYEMYVMLVSFEKQWLGLQIMWRELCIYCYEH